MQVRNEPFIKRLATLNPTVQPTCVSESAWAVEAAQQVVCGLALDDVPYQLATARGQHAYTHIARSGHDLLLCLIEAAEVNLLVDCRVRSYCGATFRPARDVRVRMRSPVACPCVYGPDRIPVRVRRAA